MPLDEKGLKQKRDDLFNRIPRNYKGNPRTARGKELAVVLAGQKLSESDLSFIEKEVDSMAGHHGSDA